MIGTNAAMMATFLDGMNESGTVAGTALANAANFTLSAIYGVLFFEESITTLWLIGFAMILTGAWILSTIQLKGNSNVEKKET
jgi:multidrug transporter EmrE-like cation transporter